MPQMPWQAAARDRANRESRIAPHDTLPLIGRLGPNSDFSLVLKLFKRYKKPKTSAEPFENTGVASPPMPVLRVAPRD